jgi:trans-aconitate methyltransferase
MSTLEQIRDGWNEAAKQNAMGNIVTTRMDWNADEFFQTGRDEINACIAHLDELGLRGDRREYALDFGCGIGRLTQALTKHYGYVIGIDIAPEMVRQARKMAPKDASLSYHCTETLLEGFADLDLIYSNITLQHMPQENQYEYIREFIRILHPDGLAVFEIPDGPEYRHPEDHLSMYAVPRETVEQVVEAAGGVIVDVEVPWHGSAWTQYRYTVKRA